MSFDDFAMMHATPTALLAIAREYGLDSAVSAGVELRRYGGGAVDGPYRTAQPIDDGARVVLLDRLRRGPMLLTRDDVRAGLADAAGIHVDDVRMTEDFDTRTLTAHFDRGQVRTPEPEFRLRLGWVQMAMPAFVVLRVFAEAREVQVPTRAEARAAWDSHFAQGAR